MKFNSQEIKHLMDDKKLSISWLARELEIDRNTLGSWFRRESIPTKYSDVYRKICDLVGYRDTSLPAPVKVQSIPYYDIDISAGELSFIDGNMTQEPAEFYQIPGLKADFIVPVFGESMTDVICPGDKIAVKRIEDLTVIPYGQKFLIVTNEHRMVKYVRKHEDSKYLLLVSENPRFDPIEIPRRKILALFKVVEVLKREEI